FAPHGPPRRPRPHPASVWPLRRRAIVPGGAMSVLPRMGQMRFLLRPRGPRSITPGAPPSRRANAASTRPSRGDIFTEQLAGHFHWTATGRLLGTPRDGQNDGPSASTGGWRWSTDGTSSADLLNLRLRLLQPVRHVHFAIHRRRGGERT